MPISNTFAWQLCAPARPALFRSASLRWYRRRVSWWSRYHYDLWRKLHPEYG